MKDKTQFTTIADFDENGNLRWHIVVTYKSHEMSEEFKEALWDQFSVEIDKEKVEI